MALSAKRPTPRKGNQVLPVDLAPGVKTGVTIYQGGMVAVDSTGYLLPAATSTSHYIMGVAQESVTNAGASGSVTCKVKGGIFQFDNSSATDEITITEMGQMCFIVDDCTVAKTTGSGTRSRAGVVVGVDAGGVWVAIHPYGIPTGFVTLTGSETLTNKTLTTPTIASFANAAHTHANAAGGGLISEAAVTPGTAFEVLRTNAGATASEFAGRLIGGAAIATFTAGALTIQATEGAYRFIDATATNSTLTLGTTGAVAGDFIMISRATAGAHTVAVVNGGAGAGTLMTMTASKVAGCKVAFDGTNWRLVSTYQEP